jgi:hypothetical protein
MPKENYSDMVMRDEGMAMDIGVSKMLVRMASKPLFDMEKERDQYDP